ncbi:acetyl-CoA synthetase-like protein [Teratosphaeria nubilosa]|uniref:Very long-chain fatty acid transport protein n=1 Tax=Teratosphaeria nubilosa TaxID=161662 RepID=A0A6G1LJ95_9PEZI|nr:acetyl-CoA synthetase-like protein [Teratosphaeria nubilosa]
MEMAAVPIVAAGAAAGVAAGAYLDAKYHIRKDLANALEQRKLRSATNARARAKKLSVWYQFEEVVQRIPQQRCIWFRTSPSEPTLTFTWQEVYNKSLQWGSFLEENGVRPNELIACYLQNGPDFMFNLLGSWAVGSAPAWINYNLGGDSLVHSLKTAGANLLVVDEDEGCVARVEEVRGRIEKELGMTILIVDSQTKADIFSHDPKRPDDSYRAGVKPDSPIFLFYTSGTTGHPKACPFLAARVGVLGLPRLRTTGLKAGTRSRKADVWYDCMPLYHGTGGTTAIGCMMTGVTLAIGKRFSVRNFWRDIHDSEANAFVYVGETARYLLAAPPSPLDKDHKLKAMYGNGMRPDVWLKFQERFNIPCVNEFFNSTEGVLVLMNACRGPFHVAHVGHHGALERMKFDNIIVPVQIDYENGTIWRDPKTGFAKRTSYNEGGEIVVKCQSEKDFVGYYNNPSATVGRFERNVFKKGDLYYRTGDALRRDDDGRWYFLDRLGDTFRWKSENVSTAEVAEVLGRFPGVVEANVYGVELPNQDGRAGCAAIFVHPDGRATFDWAGLLAHARKGLPKYAVPVFVRLIKAPTPSHNNKQNKVPLRREGVDLSKIREGEAGREDVLFWVRPGGSTYERFGDEAWNDIMGGRARL